MTVTPVTRDCRAPGRHRCHWLTWSPPESWVGLRDRTELGRSRGPLAAEGLPGGSERLQAGVSSRSTPGASRTFPGGCRGSHTAAPVCAW